MNMEFQSLFQRISKTSRNEKKMTITNRQPSQKSIKQNRNYSRVTRTTKTIEKESRMSKS